MKKNYIAYLQEYEAKTSSLAKQDKYRKKFIQTVYSQDKENQNPNLPQSSSHKKKHKAKDLRESNKEGKGSSKKKSHHHSRQPTEQRQQIVPQKIREMLSQKGPKAIAPSSFKSPSNKKVSSFSSLRSQSKKLQSLLDKKHQEQSQKCKLYYGWLKEDIDKLQSQALIYLNEIFEKAKEELSRICDNYDQNHEYMLTRKTVLPEVDLQLVSIVLNDTVKLKLQQNMQMFSIFNLDDLYSPVGKKKVNTLAFKSEEQKLECQLRPASEKMWFEGDSFAFKQMSNRIIEEAGDEEQGVSPTFKQF